MELKDLIETYKFGVCDRCLLLFTNHENELYLLDSDDEVKIRLSEIYNEGIRETTCCPCCLGCLAKLPILKDLCVQLLNTFPTYVGLWLNIYLPPAMDVARIATRTIITKHYDHKVHFPKFSELIQRILKLVLGDRFHVTTNDDKARLQLDVSATFPDQTAFAKAVHKNFCHKKKRYRGGGYKSKEDADLHDNEVSQLDADRLLLHIKSLDACGISLLRTRLTDFIKTCDSGKDTMTQWTGKAYFKPVYLFGRYNKYARDISQSPWTLSDGADVGKPIAADGDGEEEVRKGRTSVEEIVGGAVQEVFGARECHLHACGREDIDVRMLGNGRPFVLEVVEPRMLVTDVAIRDVLARIVQTDSGRRDVRIPLLKECDRAVWSGMQAVAESKRKGYRSLVWCERPVAREDLDSRLRSVFHMQDTDEEGVAALKIDQWTPLRVLHRRSLLKRVRYIYSYSFIVLDRHFFLLDIVTSAGMYVKEFVHGDLGRTQPNLRSALEAQTDILQLDVVKLFDAFEGGGDCVAGGTADAVESERTDDHAEDRSDLSWKALSVMPLPAFRK